MTVFEIIATILVVIATALTLFDIIDAYFDGKERKRRKEQAEFTLR